MLDPTVMWILGIAIVALPIVLTFVFHGTNQADARGVRVSRRWRGRSLLP